jgi:predicted nucleic acid-binding Zn ribbon protein
MSTTQAPEPSTPPASPERHCRRCGATLGPEQEWCLACGAAADTVVARPRGWRLPLVLTGAVVVLAIAAAVLAIAELSRGPEKVAVVHSGTPTPAVVPTITPVPSSAPENEGDQGATPTSTPSPGAVGTATATPSPGVNATPSPSPSPSAASVPDWPAGRSAWTVILKSASTRSAAEATASDLQAKGDTVGVLNSSEHSSLEPGYWVVFSGQYDSRSAAQTALGSLASKPADAYVRKVSAS